MPRIRVLSMPACRPDARSAKLRFALPVCTLGFLLLAPGCNNSSAPPAPSSLEMPVVRRDTQVAAATSALQLIRVELRAIAARNSTLAKQAIDNLVTLTDASASKQDHAANKPAGGNSSEAQVRSLVENWSAAIAYYVEGMDLDTLSGELLGSTDSEAHVNIRARAADSEATIRVNCIRQSDGQWSIRRIELSPRRARAAASQTSSR